MRAARAPAQGARMIVACLVCTCAAPAPPPARPDLQLTTPACASSAAPVRPGGGSVTSPDEPETSEHLGEHQGVGQGASAPSRRAWAGCTTTLLYMVAEEQRRSGGGGWWRGGGPAGGRRLPASRCGPAHWGWVGAWASVGRSWSISGAPANFRCKGVASAAFCSVLLEIVFTRVEGLDVCAYL